MTGAIGGLGTFLRQFASIREDQSRLAEEKQRYEEQKRIEQERYAAQQKQLEQDRLLQLAMSMQQFGGNVDPAFAAKVKEAGAGHLLQEQTPIASRPITSAGAGEMTTPSPTFSFKQTPQQAAFGEDRERAKQARARIEALLPTLDPTTRSALEAQLGGLNVSADDLTPYNVRQDRAREHARFEHGLRMREIGAQTAGRETPDERRFRALQQDLGDIIQRIYTSQNFINETDRQTAIDSATRNFLQGVQRLEQRRGLKGVELDIFDIQDDVKEAQRQFPNKDPKEVLATVAANRYQNDPASLQRYLQALNGGTAGAGDTRSRAIDLISQGPPR